MSDYIFEVQIERDRNYLKNVIEIAQVRLAELEKEKMKKVYWISRHDLSPAQVSAIRSFHGENVEIIKDAVVFNSTSSLTDYICNHDDGFVYAVAGAPHYLAAALAGLRFGVFENYPQKRQDGSFGLAAVYHVDGSLKKVWVNPDPMSDKGNTLITVAR